MLASENKVLNEAFVDVAQRHNGHVIRRAGLLSEFPEIIIDHRGFDTAVEVRRSSLADGEAGSSVEQLALHILHRGKSASAGCSIVMHRTTPLRNLLLHLIGQFGIRRHPSRPGWFDLETADPTFVTRCLDSNLADPLLRLHAIGNPSRIAIASSAAMFFVQRQEPLWSAQALDAFVVASLAVYDALEKIPKILAPPETNIWIISDLARSFELPKCGVCADPISHPRVVCARCAAPHHPDCWAWTGTCAIYACGSKESRFE